MDYLDPDKKRQHTRRLFIGYGLVALAIGFGTIILALLAFGYTFDRRTGGVIQNGLIFVNMAPVTADVYIDDELRGRGSQRLVLPAGEYNIEIREAGYRTWQRQVDLRGGSVERFSYPFLFPEDIAESTYRRFDSLPDIFSVSPDRRWMIIQEADDKSAFVKYDLREKVNLPSFFSLPVGVMSTHDDGGAQVSVVEWSNDNEHLIVRHQFGDQVEYILLNHSDPSESQNLTTRFSDVNFTDISLIDKQHDQYHLFDRTADLLLQAELGADVIEEVRDDVLTYRSHGPDALLYVTPTIDDIDDVDTAVEASIADDTSSDSVFLVMQENDRIAVLAELPADDRSEYLLDFARFSGDWYVAVSYAPSERVYIYQEPLSQVRLGSGVLRPEHVFRMNSPPDRISFSANARNIAIQSVFAIAVYDIERQSAYQFSMIDDEVDDIGRLQWMDGHRMLLINSDMLHVSDFDGRNRHQLAACDSGASVVFDTAYDYFYCLSPTTENEPGSYALRRHQLLVDSE